jgi:ABC-type transporter Mla MlaB component
VADAATGFAIDGERWRCVGEFTFATVATVFAATRELPLPVSGVIDCAGIGGAPDSAAVAILVALKRRAVAEKKLLTFINLPRSLLALAQLYDVEDVLMPA